MVTAKYKGGRLLISGCLPHYRRPLQEILALRKVIAMELRGTRLELPLKKKLTLSIIARKHEGGNKEDLANIVQAVCQALDGSTLGKEDAILEDDSQIIQINARWTVDNPPRA